MTATAVQVKRVQRALNDFFPSSSSPGATIPDLDADLTKARWLANLWDAQFSLAGIRFGLDAIVGLVPIAGDLAGFVAGLYPLHLARRHNLGRVVQARMLANLLADFALGSVPVVGDVIDVGFKAHLKNVKLLEQAAAKRRERGA
jgi:hypothetical protein